MYMAKIKVINSSNIWINLRIPERELRMTAHSVPYTDCQIVLEAMRQSQEYNENEDSSQSALYLQSRP